jgi:hypothetical protein
MVDRGLFAGRCIGLVIVVTIAELLQSYRTEGSEFWRLLPCAGTMLLRRY